MGFLFSKPSPLKTFDWLSSKEGQVASFDIIIIGSGPAGCVLANRLSEDGLHRVLLVEAGGSNEKEMWTKIPATWTRNIGSSIDWKYETEPQENIDDRRLFWPRGKVLGGCSSTNALIYHHGAPSDFEQWEKDGAPGWGYKDLVPYFKKAERYTPHEKHSVVDLSHRGNSGPWQTGFQYSSPVAKIWVEALKSLGVPYTPDLNTPKGTLGATILSTCVDQKGHRSSGVTAYLTPQVLGRPNLTVLIETRCTRVLLDGRRAVGVEVADEKKRDSRKRIYVRARGEGILSAGSVNTPQLLMLSGLGPRKELERVGINCEVDLPALGQNLQDHLMACLPFRMKRGLSNDWLLTSPIRVFPHLIRWMLGWRGVLTNNGAEVAAFIRTDDPVLALPVETCGKPYLSNANPDAPDVEYLSAPLTFVYHGRYIRPWFSGMVINAYMLQPVSRGYLTLKSADPFEYPVLQPNYFSSLTDLQVMVRAIRFAFRIARAEPLASLMDLREPYSKDPNATGTEEQELYGFGDWREEDLSDEDIATWVKQHTETIYHPTSAARIGSSPENSVVDTELRVHGVERLRVCDASVFPRIVSGHTTAPVIAVAEKGADIIRSALLQRMS